MSRLSAIFAPKEREFFDLFEEAGNNAVRAADLLEKLLQEWPEHGELSRDIVVCEHEGDRITQDIIQRLNQTFVTPFDREDIIALASGLDDVVDWIEEVADFLSIYRIEAPMGQAQEMATVLHASVTEIAAAIPCLRALKDVHKHTVEVNRLENEGDRILRAALAALFDHDGIDPMVVIRWKDIFERLEHAIDATETAMNTLEGVVIKNR
jgi:predicted phosphate transport protein (TIGR00153 family)